MRKMIIALIAIAVSVPAMADDLTLNDLPRVLKDLRGCTEKKSMFGNSETCRLTVDDVWASVRSDGSLGLFYHKGDARTLITAEGNSISELLRDFGDKLAADQKLDKAMLDTIAPYLPSQ